MGLDDPWWLQGTSPANMKKTYQCLKVLSKKHISPHKTNKKVLKHNTLAKSPSESLIESETPSPLPNNHFCLQAPALRLVKFETRHEELQELRSSHVEAQRQVTQLKEAFRPTKRHTETRKFSGMLVHPAWLDPFQHGNFEPSEATINFWVIFVSFRGGGGGTQFRELRKRESLGSGFCLNIVLGATVDTKNWDPSPEFPKNSRRCVWF